MKSPSPRGRNERDGETRGCRQSHQSGETRRTRLPGGNSDEETDPGNRGGTKKSGSGDRGEERRGTEGEGKRQKRPRDPETGGRPGVPKHRPRELRYTHHPTGPARPQPGVRPAPAPRYPNRDPVPDRDPVPPRLRRVFPPFLPPRSDRPPPPSPPGRTRLRRRNQRTHTPPVVPDP